MKFYYYYIPSDIARSGAMFLIFFIVFSIFFLLIVINFRFRVNRTRKKTKNESKPLIYIIPKHIDHAKHYIDPTEYYAFKAMIFNETEGHFMRQNVVEANQLTYTDRRKKYENDGNEGKTKKSQSVWNKYASIDQNDENLLNVNTSTNPQVSRFYGQSYKSLRRIKNE